MLQNCHKAKEEVQKVVDEGEKEEYNPTP